MTSVMDTIVCYKIGYLLSFRRKQDTLLIIFKDLKNSMPQYIQSLFNIRENKKNVRGKNKLVLPAAKTTTYGLKSTSYIAAKGVEFLTRKVCYP